jgi:hypothetical protein
MRKYQSFADGLANGANQPVPVFRPTAIVSLGELTYWALRVDQNSESLAAAFGSRQPTSNRLLCGGPKKEERRFSARSTKAKPLLDVAESARAWSKHDVAAQFRLEPVEPPDAVVSTYGLGGILGSFCFTFGPYLAKYRRKASRPSL